MKHFILSILMLFTCISVNSQGFYYNGRFYNNDNKQTITKVSNTFENYSLSIGYEKMKNKLSPSNFKYETDNLNINFMIYGVYVDASFSLNEDYRYDFYGSKPVINITA